MGTAWLFDYDVLGHYNTFRLLNCLFHGKIGTRNWKDVIRTSKANEAHHECIDLCQSNGIFATLASPIDTSVIRRMEKTQILEESGSAHVYDKGYKKTGNLRWANRTRLRTRFVCTRAYPICSSQTGFLS